jgi:hypothetical protein
MFLRENIPRDDAFEEVGLTPFAQAMPDKYKSDDPVLSYRNYYMSEEKQKIATWSKKRGKPAWYVLNDSSLFKKDLRIAIDRHGRSLKVYPAKTPKNV